MKVAMLRVGIDTGSGGIHGPLFQDGAFEYIPIPDGFGIDERTYGNTPGRRGQPLVTYFPESRQPKMQNQSMHVDPEFATFTYGDPSRPKAGLRRLAAGDMLVFYCGLEGWDHQADPALYLMGFFEIAAAGRAVDFPPDQVQEVFGKNFHVRHREIYERQKKELVLVKGTPASRLLDQAVLMSSVGRDRAGRPLKVLSPAMQEIFGSFGGKLSFQRSPTRWVDPAFTARAAAFVRSLD
jgi:hypothetical protein